MKGLYVLYSTVLWTIILAGIAIYVILKIHLAKVNLNLLL